MFVHQQLTVTAIAHQEHVFTAIVPLIQFLPQLRTQGFMYTILMFPRILSVNMALLAKHSVLTTPSWQVQMFTHVIAQSLIVTESPHVKCIQSYSRHNAN